MEMSKQKSQPVRAESSHVEEKADEQSSLSAPDNVSLVEEGTFQSITPFT